MRKGFYSKEMALLAFCLFGLWLLAWGAFTLFVWLVFGVCQ